MPTTLGLDDDLDPNEVVADLEVSFGFRFTDAEASACRTVGDIYGIICSHFSRRGDGAGRCATAMVFRHLKRAFSDLSINAKLRPATRFDDFTTLTAKALFKQIRVRTGLRLPRRRFALRGMLGGWCIFAGLIGLLATTGFDSHLWPIPVLTAAAGMILVLLDPGKMPADCQTLGDLSRKLAGLNFGQLSAAGAEARDRDLWNALVEVLSEHSLLPKSEIKPETLLLQKQLRAA
jgi:hypothetical protein